MSKRCQPTKKYMKVVCVSWVRFMQNYIFGLDLQTTSCQIFFPMVGFPFKKNLRLGRYPICKVVLQLVSRLDKIGGFESQQPALSVFRSPHRELYSLAKAYRNSGDGTSMSSTAAPFSVWE